MKHILYFEKFTTDERKNLIDNNLTYIQNRVRLLYRCSRICCKSNRISTRFFSFTYYIKRFGYWYINIAEKYNFITSNNDVSVESMNIWYKLMCLDNFYSFTSKHYSGIIYKNVSDEKLIQILKEIEKITDTGYNRRFGITYKDLIFDNELKNRLANI